MILITGGTGFTGQHVCKLLLKRAEPFKCIVRDEQKSKFLSDAGVPVVFGDVRDQGAVRKALKGCSGVINLVSFKEGHISTLISEAKWASVNRLVFISTTAIFTQLNADSKTMRLRTEAEIMSRQLNWTILRPTMIYGARGDRNMERLIKAVRRFPIHPILGSGDRLLQPIHVTDLAQAVVDSYSCENSRGVAFNLSGKHPLTYRQVVLEVTQLLRKRTILFSLPLKMAILAVEICRRLPWFPKLTAEQVRRLDEDKAFSHQAAREAWGFDPMGFSKGIKLEVEDLGLLRP